MNVHDFRIDVPAVVIEDLRDRLRGTRWPDQVEGVGWGQGTEREFLREVVAHWGHNFDWFAVQDRLNHCAQRLVEVSGGLRVHVVHERGEVEGGQPIVLLHGWPSSFVQMLPIMPMLTQPSRYGGSAGDAFDAVALSLPGYGFSDRPTDAGWDLRRIADAVVEVMEALGYTTFAGRGSDLGAGVLQQLALAYPDRLVGLHLSGTNPYLGWVPDDLTPEEQSFVEAAQDWNAREMAYAQEHSSKPQTLAHALNDSPAGLASWVLEKFRAWSDCDGDLRNVYDLDDLLTNLTVYWVTETIGSSMRLYWEAARSTNAAYGRVEVPTGMAMSDKDMFPTPRAWAERSYRLTRWTKLQRGGHFLEWETPEPLAEDIRVFFRELRTARLEG
ncbi:epoxide hydrolase [Nocardioides KLBMP 9356]|uniref:Epoxide hydrolase n=1 Tax=Nocardioides potassii TaxID=2911371 RepID=A0ABS9HD03_9ACTN|nr:epoxide hydrolase family protein [Nocardioides potassii]MCF6378110.1 epoxide hydrolase [Nocardioides potassii]